MKLKKIAALALAGVMAVSMLAGCAGKGTTNNDKNDTTTTTTAYTQYLVEALKENATVKALNGEKGAAKLTVVAGTSLQTALDAAVKVPGLPVTDYKSYISAANSSLKTDKLPAVAAQGSGVYADDSATKSVFGVVSVDDSAQNLASYVVKGALCTAVVDEQVVAQNSNKLAELKAKSSTYTEPNGNKYYFAYSYTMEVAVSTVENPVTHVVTYVAAYNLTRTATKTAVEA